MRRRDAYLLLTAFVGGVTSLAVELAASSLMRAHFGTANLVWATIIGLILLFLTAGYLLGGRWADRSPHQHVLFQIAAWAGFLIGIVPFVAGAVLRFASTGFLDYNIALLAGSFVTVLVLLSAPVTLLGCISPFVIRLTMRDRESSGQAAGLIYALSTAGSFLGAFLPDLVLIPTIGTRNTFVLLSLLLLSVALIGLLRTVPRRALRHAWMPIVILLLAILLRGQPVKAAEDVIFETESSYNYIQVVERDGCRYLLLNEGQAIHSVYCPDELRTKGPWDLFLIAPYFNPPPHSVERVRNVALIGLAAGTMSSQYSEVYGPIPIDGVEIDPKIVEVGRDLFAMNQPNLAAFVADGRYFLHQSDRTYSVIGIDAYRLPYIPPHLATVEFFLEVREHLTDDGVIAVNVGRTGGDRRLVEAIVATLLRVFPSAHVIDVPNSFNSVVVATRLHTERENLVANLPLLEENAFLHEAAYRAVSNLRPTRASTVVFTDDRASIELLTNLLLVNFALRGYGS
jgi:predicted membrane-bound spermidine synthase